MDLDAFGGEKLRDRRGNVLVLARQQPRRHFDHGHLAAEPAKHLGELEPDIAAADDDKMRRNKIEIEQRAVVEVLDLVEAGNRRRHGTPADIDEDSIGVKHLAIDPHLARRSEPRVTLVDRAALVAAQPLLEAVARHARTRSPCGL